MTNQAVGYFGREPALSAPLSPGIVRDGWLYVSGQVPLDLDTGQAHPGTIEDETRLVLTNLGLVLEAAGCGFEDVVKVNVHLRDMADFGGMNEVYREFFSGTMPARTTVQSVLWSNVRVEIDAIARMGG